MLFLAALPPAILIIMTVEALVLARQPPDRQRRLAPSLIAGLGLVVAWIVSRTNVAGWVVLVPLGVALGGHVMDLRRRW